MSEDYESLQGSNQDVTPDTFTSSKPYQTPIGDFSGNSIRTKGIVDEIGAFVRTTRNAKKVTGQ